MTLARDGIILVRDLQFEANHGAYADERQKRRTFHVDVELALPLARAGASDRLAETVNYEDVCDLVVAIGTARTYHLLEALCQAILVALGERYPSATIQCVVSKPFPPCEGNPAAASVKMSWLPAPGPGPGLIRR